jgi:hypothetical protein
MREGPQPITVYLLGVGPSGGFTDRFPAGSVEGSRCLVVWFAGLVEAGLCGNRRDV